MKFYYGNVTSIIDVTYACMNMLKCDDIITIPSGDANRASYFTDPLPGVDKKIFMVVNGLMTEYDESLNIKINLTDNTTITTTNEPIQIYYGVANTRIDVTNACMNMLKDGNTIAIPSGDENRAFYFTDPVPGVHKKIFIVVNDETTEYDEFTSVKINTNDNTLNVDKRIRIYYGVENKYINVTNACMNMLKHGNTITIPSGDGNRAFYFTDPINGVHKKIFIVVNDETTEYDEFTTAKINLENNTITTTNEHAIISNINDKLSKIHSELKMKYGSLNEELPEQKMAVRYLTGNEKVLEIGGNTGRNSMVIASILQNDKNLVTLECDSDIATLLTENRDLNNFEFHIESSALSNRKLIQRGWDTTPSETLIEGFKWVDTITLENLKTKYDIKFDTLVLDCEGAFYYILMDMPEILNNITLIIMENDYYEISHKTYIDKILSKNDFRRVYVEGGGWGPCAHIFFEVWKKNDTVASNP